MVENGKRHEPHIDDLPDTALIRVFSHLPTDHNKAENRYAAPLVCRRWRRLAQSPEAAELWSCVDVTLPGLPLLRSFPLGGLYRWIQTHTAATTALTIELKGMESWCPTNALLGALGRQLTSLRLYSDNDDAPSFEARSYAPWLALTPNLSSLELEGVVDTTIEKAGFPPGLTRLALNGCGINGLHRVPPALTQLPALRHLSLQFMEPGADLSDLTALTALEHLDLSNCSLREVPAELVALAALSSLTLNNNEELGGSSNGNRVDALADLSNLAVLEMRDCALKSIPAAITGLGSLRTLLLGYNDLTDHPVIPPGPYLKSLELLAMSDSMPEPVAVVDVLVRPLAAATSLQVLRLNRNWGVSLSTAVTAALLKGKPRFRKLEYSEEMGVGLEVAKLKRVYPRVTFKVVE